MEFKIHEHASNPTEGRLKGQYYPDIPRGNLFAFESEDKFVLTCGPQEAIVYQVIRQSYNIIIMCRINGVDSPQ